MARCWYFIQTFAGHEQKIARIINQKIEERELDPEVVFQVKAPMQEMVDVRNGKKHVKNELLMPGYLMLEMDLPQIGWKAVCSQILRIQGVSFFVGTPDRNVKPRPISTDEAKRILQLTGDLKGEKNVRVKQDYEEGDKVKITEGPFAGFDGAVEAVNAEKNKLRVNVEIFGRSTPVEVDVLQVEKI